MTESIARFPVRCASTTKILLLELAGPITPKARPRFGRNGHAYTANGYRSWKAGAIAQLTRAWGDRPPVEGAVAVDIKLTGKHLRGGDSDNIAGAILDAMVQAGILKSDNLIHLPELSIALNYNPKKEPMATIQITEITP